MATETYKIVRYHCDTEHPDHQKVIETGLTLEEAQEHCNDESTHGGDYDDGTAWFDGYTRET
jgi:hypothetical protein